MIVKAKQYIRSLPAIAGKLNTRWLLIGVAALPALCLTAYSIYFFVPKSVQHSYQAEKSCIGSFTLLPSLLHKQNSTNFALEKTGGFIVKGYPITSNQTCVHMTGLPDEYSTETLLTKPLGTPLASKISVRPAELPSLSDVPQPNQLVSTREIIELNLTQPDKIFEYKVAHQDKSIGCTKNNQQLQCDLAGLKLAQSKNYSLKIERFFKGESVGTVAEFDIRTVDPIAITATSIVNGSTVYDSLRAIEITANKALSSHKNVTLSQTAPNAADIPADITIKENKLIINPSVALPREATFTLQIETLSAEDNGYLDAPFRLSFSTSGGPNVSSTNIGRYGVSQNPSIILTFDYDLQPNQNLAGLLSVQANGTELPTRITTNGRTISIALDRTLPRCTPFTVTAKPGVNNIHGITNPRSWNYASRTICQVVFNIGTSAQGRPITAYKFGAGPSTILYLGATHGDEIGSKYLLDSWVQELEANYDQIPAHRTIVVIPMLNPDGVAHSTRTNANNVDLNRNFPANNWKADVVMPGGNLVKNGGGTASLSEPESKAIAQYISSTNPRLVLTYHSKGSMVIANEAGDSTALAQVYGNASGYWARSESQLGTTFAYDTTGAMENWLYDKPGIPALLVELTTHSYNEFYKNKLAMWHMVKL